MSRPTRVLIAKPGLDGHDRGAKVVALALRQAGFEVIYTGLHQTIEHIVEAAAQEDIDVLGLSILSGAHLPYTEKLMARLGETGLRPITIIGGNIPTADIARLLAFGVDGVFPTGSRFDEIVDFLRARVQAAESGSRSGYVAGR